MLFEFFGTNKTEEDLIKISVKLNCFPRIGDTDVHQHTKRQQHCTADPVSVIIMTLTQIRYSLLYLHARVWLILLLFTGQNPAYLLLMHCIVLLVIIVVFKHLAFP